MMHAGMSGVQCRSQWHSHRGSTRMRPRLRASAAAFIIALMSFHHVGPDSQAKKRKYGRDPIETSRMHSLSCWFSLAGHLIVRSALLEGFHPLPSVPSVLCGCFVLLVFVVDSSVSVWFCPSVRCVARLWRYGATPVPSAWLR
jgi:hypothetical protein